MCLSASVHNFYLPVFTIIRVNIDKIAQRKMGFFIQGPRHWGPKGSWPPLFCEASSFKAAVKETKRIAPTLTSLAPPPTFKFVAQALPNALQIAMPALKSHASPLISSHPAVYSKKLLGNTAKKFTISETCKRGSNTSALASHPFMIDGCG